MKTVVKSNSSDSKKSAKDWWDILGKFSSLISDNATLREEIVIPDLNIEDVNTKDLDSKMKIIDGWYDEALSTDFEKKQPEAVNQINKTIRSTHAQLLNLQAVEGQAKEIAKLLMFKYWPEIDYQKFFQDYEAMKEKFEVTCNVPVNDHISLSVEETYNNLKNIASKKTMENGHGISDEVLREIQTAIANHEHWLAYNTLSYFLEKLMFCFSKAVKLQKSFP